MKIHLNDKYKSLHKFDSDELNDFTIITGKNGSGKSQLIELISSKKNYSIDNSVLSIIPMIGFIQVENIRINEREPYNIKIWEQKVKEKIMPFVDNLSGKAPNPDQDSVPSYNPIPIYIFDNDIDINSDFGNTELLSTNNEYISGIKSILANRNVNIGNLDYHDLRTQIFAKKSDDIELLALEKELIESLRDSFSRNKYHIECIKFAMSRQNKKLRELTEIDFYNTPINEALIASNNLFDTSISSIFFSYAMRRHNNQYSFFLKESKGKKNDAVTDEEFINNNPEPWKILNDLLEEKKMPFYVKEISNENFHESMSYSFSLYKKDTHEEIQPDELSSGEKYIIGLILKLFTYNQYKNEIKFPDLIVFDEPDAFLHPEMSKLLIDVLYDIFVKKCGIKVIMTTHSPTTVALAPEDSIFELKNGVNTSLKKVTKDYALNLLTSFIPTLKIDYKDRRYIFVEDEDDKKYYESIYAIHNLKKKFTSTLFFMGKGGCVAVKQNVETLLNNELENVYGIVDWDNKDTSEKNIFVHGENVGYSLESYLYDPIYIMAILIETNYNNIKNYLKIPKHFNINRLDDLTNEELQNLVDWYFSKIKTSQKINEFKNPFSEKPLKINYHNGKSIYIPEGYNLLQGHDELYPLLYDVFPLFEYGSGKKFNSAKVLNEYIIKLIATNYPFVNDATIDLLEKLVSNP